MNLLTSIKIMVIVHSVIIDYRDFVVFDEQVFTLADLVGKKYSLFDLVGKDSMHAHVIVAGF